MKNLRRYAIVWWAVVLTPWVVGAGFLVASVSSGTPNLMLADACHHLTLTSPLLGHVVAGRYLRAADHGPLGSRALVRAPTPFWALGACLVYTGLTTMGYVVIPAMSYVAFLGVFAFGVARIAFNFWWLVRCARSVVQVGFLRQASWSSGPPRFVLSTMDGMRTVQIDSMDDEMVDVCFEKDMGADTWHVLIPNEELARAVRESKATPKKADLR